MLIIQTKSLVVFPNRYRRQYMYSRFFCSKSCARLCILPIFSECGNEVLFIVFHKLNVIDALHSLVKTIFLSKVRLLNKNFAILLNIYFQKSVVYEDKDFCTLYCMCVIGGYMRNFFNKFY